MEAWKNGDPKALAFWGKAAGIALKGMAGVLLGGGIGLVAVLALLPKKLRDLANELVEARRGLAEINGAQAINFARLDMQRFGRNVTFAQRTAGSTGDLTRSLSKLEDRLAPYGAAAVNLLNMLVAQAVRNLETLLAIAEFLNPALREIVRRLAEEKGGPVSSSLAQFVLDARDGKPFKDRVKPPLRGNGPRGPGSAAGRGGFGV
jgi:hypothetical protein